MIKNITYENKEAIQNDPDLPERNMITDANMNEIKEVVNNNAQELQNEIKELEEDIKANSIIEETEQAKNLYISDASGARGRLDVLGNVEQEVTETSPSIDYPSPLKILGDNKNVLNDEIFQNVKIENSASILGLGNVDIELKNTTYRARIYFTDGTYVIDNNLALYAYNSNNTSLFGLGNTGATRVTNAEQVKYVKLVCNSTGIETYKGKTIKGIKIEEGSTATSYSPYGQGSTEVNIENGNLFDGKWEMGSINVDTGNNWNTDVEIRTEYIRIEPNTDYTASRDTTENAKTRFYDKDKNYLGSGAEQGISYAGKKVYTFKSLENAKYIRFNIGSTDLNYRLQLEKGATVTNFVEHQEQNYILDIQKPMLKWDYFDLERKKEVHVTNKIILDGTKKFVVGNPAGRYYLDTELNNLSYEAISNCFKQGTENTFNVDNTIVLQTNRINLMNKEIATAEEFNNAVLELYNVGTPIEIYYPTTEPTELDLTESQIQVLEQLNKLRLYKGVNNIFTLEDIALLQAEYGVDIQSKINSLINAKISELNQPELLNE